ncbi:MFS transporter [Thermomonas carbonis]|uniref:MFS transporter n=1 Tax=Thermomonas carbonis TaxID=1463158 RepID=A0A7G9SPX7_9GAMM|nr:MFS transporter [Thermomonas carbonis]QNN69902.1 MFS transporter [Thermomonas carbonis]GHB96254.1 MFS transporter [Thermomonas carbonis]
MSALPMSPLASIGFRWLMLYRICTLFSYQIVAVTVGWHVYELTRDPWSLGLIGLAEVIPFFCVAPFSGYLVDHLRRRRLGAIACTVLAFNAIVLALLTIGALPLQGLWPIYLAIAIGGVGRSFLGPVHNALFARVLRRDQFARGASIGSVVFQTGLVLGPAIGGLLVGAAGKWVAYALAAVFALAAAGALLCMPVSEPPQQQQRGPVFASIGDGLRFVFGHQILLAALALDMFAVLFGGAISLAPAFIKDVLHAGPEALGILRGAPALGSVAAALWLARHPLQANAGRIMLAAVACFGACMIGFGLSTAFWLSVFFLLLSGVFDGVSVVLRSTVLQLSTPDGMRGRVSSVNSIFISSSNELGAFYAGSMARLLGLVPAVVVGGFVTIGVVGITAWKAPRLRKLDLRELQ